MTPHDRVAPIIRTISILALAPISLKAWIGDRPCHKRIASTASPKISTDSISDAYHKSKSSLDSNLAFENGHSRNSSGDGSSTAQKLVSDFCPIEGRRTAKHPTIFDKALEVMRERERQAKKRPEITN
jgi:hypothetical protein